MRKILLICFLALSIIQGENDFYTETMLRQYGIDMSIRGYTGWKRVCNSGSLQNFTRKRLSKKKQESICRFILRHKKKRNSQITRIDNEK